MSAAAAPTDPIKAAMIRTLFVQVGSQTAAGFVVAGYMVGTGWAFTPHLHIAAWAVAALLVVSMRWAASRYLLKHPPPDASLSLWARAYTASMFVTGLIWAAGFLVFAHPDQPITVALTLACFYSVAAGSTPSSAYHPPAILAILVPTYIAVFGKLVLTGSFGYILLGAASAFFAATTITYCMMQSSTLREGFRIRFENAQLLAQLQHETEVADDARHAAEQANLAKSQFLAAASHDLRQPLYALGLFSSSLDELRLDSGGRDVVRRIQDSIGTMENAFDGLLDLSKLEAGIVKPQPEPVDVDALFDRIDQVFGPQALARGLELRLRSNGETVSSDPVLLEQVAGNLVSNALRATTRGGALLAARRRGDALSFEVWDTGRGIAPDDLARIFDDYVQLDNPGRDRRRGLGLGLAIARRSIALLDSRIAVVSTPGRGSCFRFAVPLCDPVAEATEARAHVTTGLRRGDAPALLVEDDEDVRSALSDLLTRWSIPFEAEATAEAGLERLRSGRRFGLLVTDQRLGAGMTGLDLIHAMRAALADPPPAVIITGEMDSPLLADAQAAGIIVLHKPVQAARLRTLLGDASAPQPATIPARDQGVSA